MVRRLSRVTLDHYPIMLSLGDVKWGPPFKFTNYWLQYKYFGTNLQQWWIENPIMAWVGHGFIQKLKSLKFMLKSWASTAYARDETQKRALISKLDQFDTLDDLDCLDKQGRMERLSVRADILTITKREEAI